MKKSRLLILVLALAMVFSMTATAFAAAPALVVTGTGIVPGATESDLTEGILNEKAYTLDELKAIESQTYLYSAINSKATQSIFKAEGISIAAILADCSYTAGGTITVVADDGYSASINLDEERFYFPDFAAEKSAVPALLAWAEGGERGSVVIPEAVKEIGGLKSFIGQLAADVINQNAFTNGVVTIVVGEELPAVLTVGDEELTRAAAIQLGRDAASYTYTSSSGETTDNVIGVYLADLLGEEVEDTAVLSFTCADGYDVSSYDITYAEAKANKYMLAYEKEKKQKGWEALYNTAKSGPAIGYFTLYGEGIKPCKMIDSVTYAAAETAPVDPTPTTDPAPVAEKTIVLTLGTTAATINGEAKAMDVAPEVVTVNGGGVTFVPVRFVTENLGLTNNWSAAAPNDVVLTGEGFNGKIVIGSTAAVINGADKTLLAAPFVKDNRTMVPLRFLSENLGYSVNYDAATQTITIK